MENFREGRWSTPTTAVSIATAVSLLLLGLWEFLDYFLKSSQGYDLTDEGLYLLSVDGPGQVGYWSFPFGWNLRWLYVLSGLDIATFRTAGAFLLVVLGAIFGLVAGFAFRAWRPSEISDNKIHFFSPLLSSFMGGAATLFYYAGLVRTPSYNWLNLVGLLLAAAGLLLVFSLSGRGVVLRYSTVLISSLVASVGLFLATPAKPSSPVFFVILGWIVLLLSYRRVVVALVWTVATSVFAGLWVILAWLIGLWPANFLSVFFEILQAPVAHSSQTVRGALINVPTSFSGLLDDLFALTLPQALVLATGLSLLLTGISRKRRGLEPYIFVLGGLATLIGVLAISRTSIPPVLFWGAESRWVYQPFVTSVAVLLTIATFISWSEHRKLGEKSFRRSRFPLLVLLVSLPIVFGFGSTHEPYRQAALALVFWLVLGANLVFDAHGWRLASVLGLHFAFLGLSLNSIYVNNMMIPYRMEPIEAQVEPLRIGVNNSQLFVDIAMKESLEDLRTGAFSSGWSPGDPLIGLVWRWNASVPYFLGATVPDSLMVTIFGYEPAPEIASHNIQFRQGDFPWDEAWVLTSNPNSDDPDWQQVIEVAELLGQRSGLRWPDDYELVFGQEDYALWKPDR